MALGWLQILRLGLVQAAIGSMVVLSTSTLNRVMVVELALPALLPGVLVAVHYLVQVSRPRMGHGADCGGRSTPWIIGGLCVLAAGSVGAAASVALMGDQRLAGMAAALLAFTAIGIGVSAAGTSLLALLAKRVQPTRRAAAAAVVWLMMIVGFAVTAGVAGALLDPYSPQRLVTVTGGLVAAALLMAVLALHGIERSASRPAPADAIATAPAGGQAVAPSPKPRFAEAIAQTWADPVARRFTVFVFVAMLAYSAQDLILEPFAGTVFGLTPGQSTALSGVQHGGVLAGMLLAAAAGNRWRGRAFGSLRSWTLAGCLASALALLVLASTALVGDALPLRATVFALGMANGVFSIAAIGSMMLLAGAPSARGSGTDRPREGIRVGVWGAAQALAFAAGGLVGTGASDLAQRLIGSPDIAYAAVFGAEALLFVAAARLAGGIGETAERDAGRPATIQEGMTHGTA